MTQVLGLKGLLAISSNDAACGKAIKKKLIESEICGVVDLLGQKLMVAEPCEGSRMVWLEEIDPLRNTGWSVLKTNVKIESGKDGDYLYVPDLYKSWVVFKYGEEFIYLRKTEPRMFSIKELEEKRIPTPDKPSFPLLSSQLEIESDIVQCKGSSFPGGKYWFCEDELILIDGSSKETFLGLPIRVKVKKEVRNPRIHWLQPYAIVSGRLIGESMSNFFSLEMPSSSLSIASIGRIRLEDHKDYVVFETSSPSYMTYSKVPDFTILRRLRTLIEGAIAIDENELPDIEVKPPILIVRSYELVNHGSIWQAKIEVTNPLPTTHMMRLTVYPPHYIWEYSLKGEAIEENADTNSIEVPLPGISSLKINITTRKRAKFFTLSEG